MIFRRRFQHKLPKFPPNVIPTFKQLCREISPEEIPQLRTEVDTCLEELRTEAQQNELVNLQLAEEIAERCRFLLERYEQFGASQRKLIIGAVCYFAVEKDPFSDSSFASGMDDDAKVMNYVLQQIGVEDRYIDHL